VFEFTWRILYLFLFECGHGCVVARLCSTHTRPSRVCCPATWRWSSSDTRVATSNSQLHALALCLARELAKSKTRNAVERVHRGELFFSAADARGLLASLPLSCLGAPCQVSKRTKPLDYHGHSRGLASRSSKSQQHETHARSRRGELAEVVMGGFFLLRLSHGYMGVACCRRVRFCSY